MSDDKTKPAAAAAKDAKVNYLTTRLVQHDGEDYPEGDTISLTEKQARPLLDCGAVVDPAAVAEAEDAAADEKAEKLAAAAAKRKGGK